MASGRGSKHKLKLIKESVLGTTPATPTMLEIPINTYSPDVSVNVIRSEQIRTHPFVDRLLQGAQTNDFQIVTELQDDNHDLLLELLTGQAWSSDVTKFADVLVGASMESEHSDLTLFDQFTGACIKQAQFNFPAQADGKVTAQYDLLALTGVMDQGTTIATAVTAASAPDPYTFAQATVTIGGASKPVTSLTITAARQIDPLYLLGTRQPSEYIPSAVTVTGQIVIPLVNANESARLIGFTEAALVAVCTQSGNSRTFTLPKINYAKMSRPIQNRGVILQTIDFEAKYDITSGTVMSIGRT
jgi:hypothetical protein